MLRLDLRPGEGIDIDSGRVVIRLEQKSGQTARITVDAAREIDVRVMKQPSVAAEAEKGLKGAK